MPKLLTFKVNDNHYSAPFTSARSPKQCLDYCFDHNEECKAISYEEKYIYNCKLYNQSRNLIVKIDSKWTTMSKQPLKNFIVYFESYRLINYFKSTFALSELECFNLNCRMDSECFAISCLKTNGTNCYLFNRKKYRKERNVSNYVSLFKQDIYFSTKSKTFFKE